MPRFPIIAVDETGKRHGPFATAVSDELLRMQVMWQDATGEYRIRSADVDIVALNPHIAVCDICSTPPVTWDADVDEFDNFDPTAGPFARFHSCPGFFLCEPCGQLVLDRDRAGLQRRQLREFMKRWAVDLALDERVQMRSILEDQARQMHELFWQNLRGIKRL